MTSRLARNDGFSTVAIMITMMLSSLLVIAAFATANNGTPLARNDQNQKQAYSAAEAGVAFYAAHVAQDPNFWTYCTSPPSPASPNPLWDGVSGTRTWRDVPSSTDPHPAQYSITLIPPQGSTKCQNGLASSTFLDPQTGTFTIRSTGRYRGRMRSIVATFKRKGFVDFLWFTNFETADPLTYPPSGQSQAIAQCQQFNRAIAASPGPPATPATPGRPSPPCKDQTFPGFDSMLGPMHTNDRYQTCNQPTFGGTANDVIESVDPNEFETTCGPALPKGAGTKIGGAPPLDFPPSNTDLADDTLFNWTFTGQTKLVFNANGTVDITNQGISGACHCATRALPPNNVIYVKNGNCTSLYQEAQRYTPQAGCGDATIHGNYPVSLTVGADNDIVIDGNVKRSDPAAEMGLIANGFIRVYHPIQFTGTECDSSNSDAPGAMHDVEIDAAILSLRHSFLVDNPACGDAEGSLTIDGAIAQWFRGTVGTFDSGGGLVTGYKKNYLYDQHLRYADPPYFLDPVETSWNVVRETEQVPAQ